MYNHKSVAENVAIESVLFLYIEMCVMRDVSAAILWVEKWAPWVRFVRSNKALKLCSDYYYW